MSLCQHGLLGLAYCAHQCVSGLAALLYVGIISLNNNRAEADLRAAVLQPLHVPGDFMCCALLSTQLQEQRSCKPLL